MIQLLFFPLDTSIHPDGFSKSMIQSFLDHHYPGVIISYVDQQPVLSNKHFISIAHKDKLMVVAISDYGVGIDIEKNVSLKPELIKHQQLPLQYPLLAWCIKEAFYKMTQQPLHDVETYLAQTHHGIYQTLLDSYLVVVVSEKLSSFSAAWIKQQQMDDFPIFINQIEQTTLTKP